MAGVNRIADKNVKSESSLEVQNRNVTGCSTLLPPHLHQLSTIESVESSSLLLVFPPPQLILYQNVSKQLLYVIMFVTSKPSMEVSYQASLQAHVFFPSFFVRSLVNKLSSKLDASHFLSSILLSSLEFFARKQFSDYIP